MLKKFGLYSLGLALLATLGLGQSQQEKKPPAPSSTDALTAKQRAEAINKDQLTQLMSRIGVHVSDANTKTTPIAGYRQLNISLSTPDQPQTTDVEQLRTSLRIMLSSFPEKLPRLSPRKWKSALRVIQCRLSMLER